jgi:hypothetical protein
VNFSRYFELDKTQAELDFVDIDLESDVPLFIDPYVFGLKADAWSARCNKAILSFFQSAIECVRRGDDSTGRYLLDNLNEPNETHLGLSAGRSSGRGVSGKQALDLYEHLRGSEAARSGLLSEISECDLFVDGISSDKISDMTTNIIRRELVQYTQEQCRLHGIILRGTVASGGLWRSEDGRWVQEYVQLPVADSAKILLVPKSSVRWKTSFNAFEYYNEFVLNFLQQEHLTSRSALVETLRSGERRVTKKSLKREYPLSKAFLADFTTQHPEVLNSYKKTLGLSPDPKNGELDPDFDESAFAQACTNTLKTIPVGDSSATKFHRFISGILEFLLYPDLVCPEIEYEIHEGRKRIDVRFVNQSGSGFFFHMLYHAQVAAQAVFVECKNYGKEIGNPELDQLAGRFSPLRGRLGLLIGRSVHDRDKLIKRCRDTAQDGRGIIIALEDKDVIEMLTLVANGRRADLEGIFQRRYEEVVN